MGRLAAALAVATALVLGHDAAALPLIDLSTGVGAGGLLAFGSPDDQWTVVGAPVGVPLGTATVVPPSRGRFADLEPDARWISATLLTNVDAPWGYYTYETVFVLDLPRVQGFRIQGDYATDNRLIDIRLNGNLAFVGPNVSGTACGANGCEEFLSPIAFAIEQPSWFADGLNRLRVTVENQGPTTGNPTSLVLRGSFGRWDTCARTRDPGDAVGGAGSAGSSATAASEVSIMPPQRDAVSGGQALKKSHVALVAAGD